MSTTRTTPYTADEFAKLSPAGEQAAIAAGLAPWQAAGQVPEEVTGFNDVVAGLQDYVLDALPGGALANATARVLEEAAEVFLSGEDEELLASFQRNGVAVSISRSAGMDGRSLFVQLKQGGKKVTFTVNEAG